ncbi:MAG: division/cell wall cluster transcriptional repressor MraZ [Caldithrix sp.]|nr:division/cell wall cluster transcriptional repressor MraZ [Caldithrix sp.]
MANTEFTGEYRCALDAKNRINIPSGIRKIFMPEANHTIVFTRGFESINVDAYPLNEWQRFTKELRKLNPLEKKTRNFNRLFVGSAFQVNMDSQGRVMIPERIINLAKIQNEVLIIGVINKLEIWNPKIYEQYLQDENLNLADVAEDLSSVREMFFEKGD